MLTCNDCGTCCIDVGFPKTLRTHDSCCFCGEEVEVLIAANEVIGAGTILGEITGQPQTYKAFDSAATDGTQKALVILKYDVCTDDQGRITNWSGVWGCGRNTTKAYVCGKFDARALVGDLDAAKASGMPIRVINGFAFVG